MPLELVEPELLLEELEVLLEELAPLLEVLEVLEVLDVSSWLLPPHPASKAEATTAVNSFVFITGLEVAGGRLFILFITITEHCTPSRSKIAAKAAACLPYL